MAYLFDADDQASVEILCNNCGGAGHLARVCPSSRKARSHKYMASLHLAQAERKDKRGVQRRVPGRGQRPPFRSFSKRFQPRRSFPPGLGTSGGNPKARSAEEGEWELRPIGEVPKDTATSSSSSSSQASEQTLSATESASRAASVSASTTPSNPPFAFSASDDALFSAGWVAIEAEAAGRVAIEREPVDDDVRQSRSGERSPNRLGEGPQLDGEEQSEGLSYGRAADAPTPHMVFHGAVRAHRGWRCNRTGFYR